MQGTQEEMEQNDLQLTIRMCCNYKLERVSSLLSLFGLFRSNLGRA